MSKNLISNTRNLVLLLLGFTFLLSVALLKTLSEIIFSKYISFVLGLQLITNINPLNPPV